VSEVEVGKMNKKGKREAKETKKQRRLRQLGRYGKEGKKGHQCRLTKAVHAANESEIVPFVCLPTSVGIAFTAAPSISSSYDVTSVFVDAYDSDSAGGDGGGCSASKILPAAGSKKSLRLATLQK